MRMLLRQVRFWTGTERAGIKELTLIANSQELSLPKASGDQASQEYGAVLI